MTTAKITNIILEDKRFKVFVTFNNGIQETNVFLSKSNANDILAWLSSRIDYYDSLEQITTGLKEELLQKEYDLKVFDVLYDTDPEFKSKVDTYKNLNQVL